MKKKVKLFSTIASLCLAVALMAFGVWAATTTVNFKTKSTVSFTAATDVYGTFKATVAKDGTVDAAGTIAVKRVLDVTGATNKDWEVDEGNTVEGALDKVVKLGDVAPAGAELPNQTVAKAGETIVYTYTFTNKSPYAVKYTFTIDEAGLVDTACEAATPCENPAIKVDFAYSGKNTTATGTLAENEVATCTITIKLNCIHRSADKSYDTGMSLVVEKAQA